MIDTYSDNWIVEDAWGDVPLMYAIWGDAPSEIVEFLVSSYQSLYPNHEFDWNTMVITLGRASAPAAVVENLLDVQHTLSPGYHIDWDQVVVELAERTNSNNFWVSPATFCFLTRCSITTRVNAIGVNHFRDAMAMDDIGYNYFDRHEWHNETLTKLEYYESEYRRLKESTSLLELTMWKKKIDDSSLGNGDSMGDSNKKWKNDVSDFRLQCRISCGADHVVENVCPYLLPPDYVRSYVPDDDDEDEGDYSDEFDEDEEVEDDNDYKVDEEH
jgi:hypothetical protein